MKTPANYSPRFACRAVRTWMAVFGDTTAVEPRGFGSGHVGTCVDCQRFFRVCNEIDFSLKREAVHQVQVISDGLEQRINFAVSLSIPEPRSRRTYYVSLALAGAGACLALAIFVFRRQTSQSSKVTATHSLVAAGDAWASVKPSAEALLSGEPLQQEVDAVVSDAQSAIRFLKGNFLPSSPDSKDRRG